MTIYYLFERRRQFNEIMSNCAIHRDRYIRLMILASVDMIVTIPLSSYYMALDIKRGLEKYSWAVVHRNWSHIPQYPRIEWQSDPELVTGLEVDRWSIVVCAFIFFGFFGFTDEAREHYHRVYTSISRRVGYSTPSSTLARSLHAYGVHPTPWFRMFGSRSFSTVSNQAAGAMASVVMPGNRRDSDPSFSDQLSMPSISMTSDPKQDFKIEQDSPSEPTASSSSQGQLPQLPGTADVANTV
jgi:pheromone a factor receptor